MKQMNDLPQFKKWIFLDNKTGFKYKESVIKKYNLDWFNFIISFKEIYNLEFKQSIFHIINDLAFTPKCESGIEFKFNGVLLGYSDMCKDKCKSCKDKVYNKIKENNLKKWGVSNPMQLNEVKKKQKKNNLEKWGVENVFQNKEIKEKIKSSTIKKWGVDHHTKTQESKDKKIQTNLKKWGVEHSTQNKEVRKKAVETNLKKWGVSNPMQLDEVKKKQRETNLKRWGVEHTSQNEEIRKRAAETNLKKWGAKTWAESDYALQLTLERLQEKYSDIKEYNYSNKTLLVNCPQCTCGKGEYEVDIKLFKQRINVYNVHPCININPIKDNISSYHNDVVNFIKNVYNDDILQNNRNILNGKEIDIWIPGKNLGIEFNGVYWHSELFKPKGYHQQKSLDGLNQNINIFHIWEDDWKSKPHIIKSMIQNKLGLSKKLGARKCEIREVSSSQAKSFLEKNHLQGSINSSVRIGLFFENELVSLMTFGKLRNALNQSSKSGEWELYRFANKLGLSVQGSFSKLLNQFIYNYNPTKIRTYASLDHSVGNVYNKNGFEFLRVTTPGYWWVINGIKQHRYGFRKDLLVKLGADPNLSESQIMNGKGYYKVWDSGNLVYEYNV